MARRYRKKKRRRKKKGSPKSIILRGPSVVPDQIMLKMKYRDLVNLNSPQGVYTYRNYRGNSIFDPDQQSIGKQPLGRDQWDPFYQRYQVMASKCVVRFAQSKVNGANLNCCLTPTDGVGVLLDIVTQMEQPYSKSKLLCYDATAPKVLSSYMTTKKKFGYSKGITQNDQLSALNGNNPAEQWYWVVGVAGTGGQMSVDLNIEITYYVRLFDRKELPRS